MSDFIHPVSTGILRENKNPNRCPVRLQPLAFTYIFTYLKIFSETQLYKFYNNINK